jgi:hypothetical protein
MSRALAAQYQDLRDSLDAARLMATSTHDGADRDQLDDMLAAFREASCFLADTISDLEYEIAKETDSTLDMFAANAADERFRFDREMSFCDIRRTASGSVL